MSCAEVVFVRRPMGAARDLGCRTEIGRLLRDLQRIKRLGDHRQLSGVLQFAEQSAVDGGHEALGVARAPKIGDRDGGLLAVLVDSTANLRLRLRIDKRNAENGSD